jgi:hypothetical protein
LSLRYRRAREVLDADPEQASRILDGALPLSRGPAYGEFAAGSRSAAPAI